MLNSAAAFTLSNDDLCCLCNCLCTTAGNSSQSGNGKDFFTSKVRAYAEIKAARETFL